MPCGAPKPSAAAAPFPACTRPPRPRGPRPRRPVARAAPPWLWPPPCCSPRALPHWPGGPHPPGGARQSGGQPRHRGHPGPLWPLIPHGTGGTCSAGAGACSACHSRPAIHNACGTRTRTASCSPGTTPGRRAGRDTGPGAAGFSPGPGRGRTGRLRAARDGPCCPRCGPAAVALRDLPDSVRAQFPALQVSGVTYSSNPLYRMAIVNGQVLHEGGYGRAGRGAGGDRARAGGVEVP